MNKDRLLLATMYLKIRNHLDNLESEIERLRKTEEELLPYYLEWKEQEQ